MGIDKVVQEEYESVLFFKLISSLAFQLMIFNKNQLVI